MAKKATKKKVAKKKTTKKVAAKQPEKTCFVIMPFKSPFDLYYKTLYIPAIKDAKLKHVRADDLFRPSAIVSDLWKMIQDAEVILAELTTKNANVFYELGLSHAIGKPVILISETMDDVPFDLQQLRVITYDKDDPDWGDNLKANITSSIKETLESPVEAVPSIFRKKVQSHAPIQSETIARIQDLEDQMRMLRRPNSKSNIPVGTYSMIMEDLKKVESTERGLIDWADRWRKRGVKPEFLWDYVNKTHCFETEERIELANHLGIL
jgi:hypothetical protein